MAWSRSTKQRRSMARRRGRNGDFKRRFLERTEKEVDRHLKGIEAALVRAFEVCKAEAHRHTVVWPDSGFRVPLAIEPLPLGPYALPWHTLP